MAIADLSAPNFMEAEAMKMELRETRDRLTLLELFWTELIIDNPEEGYCC